MADRPQHPRLTPQAEAALVAHRAGAISAEVALMRILLSGLPAAALPALLRDDAALLGLAKRQADHLAALERVVRAGTDHAPGTGLEATRAMFDRLVALAPEASVAAYSLGDPATLAAATAELVAWLCGHGLLAGRPRVLDLGCGIGRVAAALAPDAGEVLGLDISAGMIAEARRRHPAPNLRFERCGGRDLAGVPDAGFDLLLAVDVFPYLVQDSAEAAARMLAEAERVLAPGGTLAILNYDYGTEESASPRHAAGPDLLPVEDGTTPFRLWDARAYRLLRR